MIKATIPDMERNYNEPKKVFLHNVMIGVLRKQLSRLLSRDNS